MYWILVFTLATVNKKPKAKTKRIPQLSHNLLRQIVSIQGFLKMDSYLFTTVGYFHIIETLLKEFISSVARSLIMFLMGFLVFFLLFYFSHKCLFHLFISFSFGSHLLKIEV